MKYISVFIPTFNGDKYIGSLIDSLLVQDLPKGYDLEIVIIDSGSSDSTVDIIKKYGDKINLTQIANTDYGHGKTRQQGVEIAKGEYILILSQDATPAHERWVKNMIEPFFISDKVGCVFGRQIPRPDAVPTIKREILSVFGQFGPPDSITLSREHSLVDGASMNSLNTFFSDVNSAIRKDLNSIVPFRDVAYAEDQALAEDMQNAGFLKAYSVQGTVVHSNEYSVKEYYSRKFDEFIGLQESVNYKLVPSRKSLYLGWVRPTIDDLKFIRRDGEYSKKRKVRYALLSIGYNYMAGKGRYDAARFYKNKTKREQISLEAQRRNK